MNIVRNAICSAKRWTYRMCNPLSQTSVPTSALPGHEPMEENREKSTSNIRALLWLLLLLFSPIGHPSNRLGITQPHSSVKFQTFESNSGDWPMATWTRHVSELCCARKRLPIETLTPVMEQINLHLRWSSSTWQPTDWSKSMNYSTEQNRMESNRIECGVTKYDVWLFH